MKAYVLDKEELDRLLTRLESVATLIEESSKELDTKIEKFDKKSEEVIRQIDLFLIAIKQINKQNNK